ncbi:MAG TPA: hypothetical protein DCE41_37465 [Cytophagales bacterium]|nr:hypothetical protein [Cytophagales bacterium]HAA20576.1 hypothetical protein [Cytophagales bacterium]HAP65172.1 hypothetical protein [Cytophagales bacterium]
MGFKHFRIRVLTRVILIGVTTMLLVILVSQSDEKYVTAGLMVFILFAQLIELFRFTDKTNQKLTRFLESIRYSDFATTFTHDHHLGKSFRQLNLAFTEVLDAFRKAREEKEESFLYLQTVVQHVSTGLLSFDQDGHIELINNTAKRYIRQPAIHNVKELNSTQPDLYKALQELTPGSKTLLRLNHNLHLAMSATELILQGKSIKLVALHNIVSELQQKEIDAWQNLTRVLRHEIMNSVTPISSLTSTMKDILAEDLEELGENDQKIANETVDDIQLGLDTIQNRSHGLIRFVDAYRNITNIPEPEFQHVALTDLLARTEQLMRAEMVSRSVTFEYQVEESLSSTLLSADPELIEQVLINLVKNAMEAVEGKEGGKISLQATPNDEHRVQVRVIDNGPGIIPEAQERIFVPFYTTKKRGSGIGLALSRQIMQLHNGSLTVESEPDQQTVFTMHF